MHRFFTACWQVAAFAEEVVVNRPLARRILDHAIVFFRTREGVTAMEDRCPHRSAPLSKGTQVGDTLRCGYHGLRFATDGRCVEIPGQDTIPANARVRTFPLLEKHRLLWIWMGEPSKADSSLIPQVPWMDDSAWLAATGYHFVAAHYQLLNDNLLDLSHETYLHALTIGNEAVAQTPVAVRSDGECIRVEKHIAECLPPPFYQYLGRLPSDVPVRRWQRTRFEPPGYTVINVGVEAIRAQPGTNRVEGRVINLVTPATATSSHYFWAFARNFRLHEHAVTEFLRDSVGRTFDEDRDMLEAQQRNLAADVFDPRYKLVVKNDAAPLRARRLLAGLVSRESETARGSSTCLADSVAHA